MLNQNKLLLISLMIMSTLISVTSHSWMGIWMGLEINLMSFIPLITKSSNLPMSEAMISYFIIQTISSISLLFFIIMSKITLNTHNLFSLIINSALLMKMGAAPFHFWFPKVMSGLTWMNCFILSTWQKITPIIAIYMCINKIWILMAIIMSALIGAIGGINQSSIRVILSFSSISHLSWMLMSLMISMNMWMLYFTIYFFLNYLIIIFLNLNNLFYLNQLYNSKISLINFLIFNINLLSLGGIPPFLGFLPKWLIIQFMSLHHMNIMIIFMMTMTLITLSYYMNILLSALMLNYSKTKWFKIYPMPLISSSMIFLFTSISMFSLIFISLMN
uniref:NADH-ubiquinone oxidoreductase chain 2 n=1 Tax=Rhyacophila quadrifida TaxID=2904903 RepID=A0A9E8LPB2_9NEOP|nr:NADH dehydrogenase subunit 2 [Rhyacophila quadrifida]UZZ44364.1 NADH dehydrogenase subunit 2 [Rhyacophila quadrifida]